MSGFGRAAVLLATLGTLVLCAGTAHAAFPGTNGQIVYTGSGGLKTVFPDGTGVRGIGTGNSAAWSPDGRQIAFVQFPNPDGAQVWVADADGSHARAVVAGSAPSWAPDGRTLAYSRSGDIFVSDVWTGGETMLIGGANSEGGPAWSPDGTKVAFSRLPAGGGPGDDDIWVVNADGSGATNLTNESTLSDLAPDWSPDGTRIAFTRGNGGFPDAINVMNADGTGIQAVTAGDMRDEFPAWSPDGNRIAFFSKRGGPVPGITTMNADGSSMFRASPPDEFGSEPSWQPAVSGYPRPKGASPMRIPLVPTYNLCFSPNETHGPPLAFTSCNPPTQQSLTLTVGTPDANGSPANAVAFARFASVAGNPATPADEADVSIAFSATDIRCLASNAACPGGTGSPFVGSALLTLLVRITDRLDGLVSTTQQLTIRAPVGCAPTSDPAMGSTCVLSTTMDAVAPGSVPEGRRSIWETTEVQVWDPGPNGTGYAGCPPTCGNGDETVFLRQGVFIP